MAQRESESAFDTKQWDRYRAHGDGTSKGSYDKLGWVRNSDLLEALFNIVQPTGTEILVDAGTGSGAVCKMMAPYVKRVFAFDISEKMIRHGQKNKPPNVDLGIGDIHSIALPNQTADIAIARMVLHHLPNIPRAVQELTRVVKEEGKTVIIEYVAVDAEVQKFERNVFDLKEAGRHLWIGSELGEQMACSVPSSSVEMQYATLKQYSVKDWLGKSGLPPSQQEIIFMLYAQLNKSDPNDIARRLNITFMLNSDNEVQDVLVDRLFAHAIIKK